MKQVLLIEDNALKETRIRQVFEALDDLAFTTCKTIKVAYPLLLSREWDLILLDMTFQVNNGLGTEIKKEPLAGLEVLQYMQARGMRKPVIVVTQHKSFSDGSIDIKSIEELDIKLRQYFPGLYRATVYVDLASDDWQSHLLTVSESALWVK